MSLTTAERELTDQLMTCLREFARALPSREATQAISRVLLEVQEQTNALLYGLSLQEDFYQPDGSTRSGD